MERQRKRRWRANLGSKSLTPQSNASRASRASSQPPLRCAVLSKSNGVGLPRSFATPCAGLCKAKTPMRGEEATKHESCRCSDDCSACRLQRREQPCKHT